MKWLGGFLLAVVLPLLLSEFTDWSPWFARRLVRRAVRRLPEDSRARWEEEWLDHLNALEGRRLSILVRGVWIYLCAPSWGRMLQGLPPISQVLLGQIRALVQRAKKEQGRSITDIKVQERSILVSYGDRTKAHFAVEELLASAKVSTVTITEADRDHNVVIDTDDGEYRFTGPDQELRQLLRLLKSYNDGEFETDSD